MDDPRDWWKGAAGWCPVIDVATQAAVTPVRVCEVAYSNGVEIWIPVCPRGLVKLNRWLELVASFRRDTPDEFWASIPPAGRGWGSVPRLASLPTMEEAATDSGNVAGRIVNPYRLVTGDAVTISRDGTGEGWALCNFHPVERDTPLAGPFGTVRHNLPGLDGRPPYGRWQAHRHWLHLTTSGRAAVLRALGRGELIEAPPPDVKLPGGMDWHDVAAALNPEHERHAPDLLTAMRCWLEVHRRARGKTQRQLKAAAERMGVKGDGRLDAIAKVATPEKRKR